MYTVTVYVNTRVVYMAASQGIPAVFLIIFILCYFFSYHYCAQVKRFFEPTILDLS